MASGIQKLLEHPPILPTNLLSPEDPGDMELGGEAKVAKLRLEWGCLGDAVQPFSRVPQVAQTGGWPTSVVGSECFQCQDIARDDEIARIPLKEIFCDFLRLDDQTLLVHGAVVEGAKPVSGIGFACQMREGMVEVIRLWKGALLTGEQLTGEQVGV